MLGSCCPSSTGLHPKLAHGDHPGFRCGEMSARGARLGVQGLQGILTKGRGTGETMTSDAGSRTMTRPPTGVVDPAERRGMW